MKSDVRVARPEPAKGVVERARACSHALRGLGACHPPRRENRLVLVPFPIGYFRGESKREGDAPDQTFVDGSPLENLKLTASAVRDGGLIRPHFCGRTVDVPEFFGGRPTAARRQGSVEAISFDRRRGGLCSAVSRSSVRVRVGRPTCLSCVSLSRWLLQAVRREVRTLRTSFTCGDTPPIVLRHGPEPQFLRRRTSLLET
jgi:hypothetical protein